MKQVGYVIGFGLLDTRMIILLHLLVTLCKVSPLLAKPDKAEVVFSVFAKPIVNSRLNLRDAAAT